MEIKQMDNEKNGAFYIEIDGMKVAEMTYSHAKPNKIIIDHTEVSETLKGQGVGYKLIDAAVEYLRLNNLKVIPLCVKKFLIVGIIIGSATNNIGLWIALGLCFGAGVGNVLKNKGQIL